MQNEHSMFKIDLNAMAKGHIGGFDTKKQITKKKKNQIGKNVFTLGFEHGFALYYLRPNTSISTKERDKIKIILNEEDTRIRIIQKKKKPIIKKKQEKKKKKTS